MRAGEKSRGLSWLEAVVVVILAVVILLMFYGNLLTFSASASNSVATVSEPVSLKLEVRSPTAVVESRGEAETRAALVRIFAKPFVKIRPSFLVNPETNRRLELDCYNEELRLAVEYSGIQHYVFPNHFHRTKSDFDAQQRRDQYKLLQCQHHGVRLLIVPYTIARPMIEAFLRQQLSYKPYHQYNANGFDR